MNIRQKVACFNVTVIMLGLITYFLLLNYFTWNVARLVLLPTIVLAAAAQITEVLNLRALEKKKKVATDERDRIIILRAAVTGLLVVCVAMIIAATVPYHFIRDNLVLSVAVLKRIMLMVPVYSYLLGLCVYSISILVMYSKE